MITKHTVGIYIILVFIVLGQLPAIALASLGLPAFAIVMLVGIVGYAVYVLRQSDTRIKTALSLFPVFTAGLGLLSSLAGSQASVFHWLILGGINTLFWFIVISVYTAKSRVYQQRYNPVQHNLVTNVATEQVASLQVKNNSNTKNTKKGLLHNTYFLVACLCILVIYVIADIIQSTSG